MNQDRFLFRQNPEVILELVRRKAKLDFPSVFVHSVKMREDELADRLIAEMDYFFWAEDCGKVEKSVEYPLGWWQAFKDQFFPEWLKRFFPIKRKVVKLTVEKKAIYPKLPYSYPDIQYFTKHFVRNRM